MTDVMASGAALRALPAALAVGDDVVQALPEAATTVARRSATELLGAVDARRATELLAIRQPSAAQVDELGDLVQRHAEDGVGALVTSIDGSPGIAGPLRMQSRSDLERYATAWRLQLADRVEPALVDAHVRDVLAAPGRISSESLAELDVLAHRFGAAERLGLATSLDGAAPSVRALPARGTAAERERYLQTWHAQLSDAGAPERVDARVRDLLASGSWSPDTYRELRHLALDLDSADRLGLPRTVAGQRVDTVLTTKYASDAADRALRAWREQLEHGTDDIAATRARLRELLGTGDPLGADAIADLRAAAIDLGGARRLGLGAVVGHEPAAVMGATLNRTPGAARVMDRLVTSWRELVDIEPAELARLDDEAVAAARRVAGGAATHGDAELMRTQVVERGGAMRLGLPEQLPGIPDSWIGTHHELPRQRYAQAWTAILDEPDAAARVAALRSMILAPSADHAARATMRTLALDLGGSFDLGLPTRVAGDDLMSLLDSAAHGTADPARLARVDEAWAHALQPAASPADAVIAARAQLTDSIAAPFDDERAGRVMHLLLDRDELGIAHRLGRSPEQLVEALSSAGRLDQPEVGEAIRFQVGMLLDTAGARAMQDGALDQLRGGHTLSAVQAELLHSDRELFRALAPELRLALLGTSIPSRHAGSERWLDDVTNAFNAIDQARVPTALRDQTTQLVELNHLRVRGQALPDGAVRGYGRHPDYAELGRIGANAQLAAQMARPRPLPMPAAVTLPAAQISTSTNTITGETLTW